MTDRGYAVSGTYSGSNGLGVQCAGGGCCGARGGCCGQGQAGGTAELAAPGSAGLNLLQVQVQDAGLAGAAPEPKLVSLVAASPEPC